MSRLRWNSCPLHLISIYHTHFTQRTYKIDCVEKCFSLGVCVVSPSHIYLLLKMSLQKGNSNSSETLLHVKRMDIYYYLLII